MFQETSKNTLKIIFAMITIEVDDSAVDTCPYSQILDQGKRVKTLLAPIKVKTSIASQSLSRRDNRQTIQRKR